MPDVGVPHGVVEGLVVGVGKSQIEETLPPEWLPVYLEVLLAKIADDRNPSIPMLKRIAAVVERVPANAG